VVPQVTAGKAKKKPNVGDYLFFFLSVLSRVTVTCKQRNSQHKAINFVFHLFSKFDIFCFNLFFSFIGGWVTVLLQEKILFWCLWFTVMALLAVVVGRSNDRPRWRWVLFVVVNSI
jgi:hypothetical protein